MLHSFMCNNIGAVPMRRLLIVLVCPLTSTFVIRNQTQFLDGSFLHVNGSACCTPSTNPHPVNSVSQCENRCVQMGSDYEAFVFQPSFGICWLGKSGKIGLLEVPGLDRISGISANVKPGEKIALSRNELPSLLNHTVSVGLGVLLGVGHGEFAKHLLSSWPGALYLVDPYIHIWRGYDEADNVDDRTHQLIYENLRSQLVPYEGRHVLVRDFSTSFADVWLDKLKTPPVFVYLDNNPAADAVLSDIQTWWPILAPGGVMAGNMYYKASVRSSVNKMFTDTGVRIYQTYEDDLHVNWVVFKPLL